MQFNKIIAGSLLTLGAVTSACQSDNIEIPKSELYTREFIKEFGVVDPNHDWNNAAQGSVTVVTSSPTHVEVLADIKGKRYIFADYRKVNGTETINFTIPKGISNIIVSLNGREVNTTLGATVDNRTHSRAIWEKEDEVVKITRTEDYRRLTPEGVMMFEEYVPEGQNNLDKVTKNFSFVSNGDFTIYPVYWRTSAFNTLGIYYIDEDKNELVCVPFFTHKITPIDGTKGNLLYTTQSNPDEEDVTPAVPNAALRDANAPLTLPINTSENIHEYFKKELNPADYNNSGRTSFLDFNDEDWKTFKRRWLIGARDAFVNAFPLDYLNRVFDLSSYKGAIDSQWFEGSYSGNYMYISDILVSPVDATHVKITNVAMGAYNKWIYPGSAECSNPGNNVTGWKSRGIHVQIKEGVRFGMYLRNWRPDGGDPAENKPSIDNVDIVRLPLDENGMPKGDKYRRFYSEAKYNTPVNGTTSFASTFTLETPTGKYRALGFEDYGADVFDLNDMIFFIHSADPDEIPSVKDEDKPEPEKYSFLLAAEDLGGTCDWDFNDLVAEVSVVAKNYIEAEEGVENSTASNPYKEVTVTPLASGGTLPIYLMYTGKVSKPEGDYNSYTPATYLIGREFHSWLTNSQGSSLTPLNVGASATLKGKSITFHIPEKDYTLASDKKYSASEGSNNMGGFWVLVINHEDTPYTPEITDENYLSLITNIPDGKGITKIEAPQPDLNIGNIAPQMLCIGHEWLWPRESKKIHSAYPGDSGFTGWLNNESFTDWYGEGKYVESLVTKRDL